MKAWAVSVYDTTGRFNSDENGVEFVWRETRGKARAAGAAEFDYPLTDIRAVRVPLLDGDGRAPAPRLIVQSGYGAECAGCRGWVFADSGESYAPDGGVYCEDCTIGACAVSIGGAGVEPGGDGPETPILLALGMATDAA